MHWRRVEAKVLARRGETARAEELAREAVALIEPTDMIDVQGDTWLDLAVVLEVIGKHDEAVGALEEAAERFERKENLLMLGHVRDRLARLQAS